MSLFLLIISMTKLELEIILDENGENIYTKNFEATDESILILLAYQACIPEIRKEFSTYLKTNYKNDQTSVIVNVQFKIVDGIVTKHIAKLEGIIGTRHDIFPALCGLCHQFMAEIGTIIQQDYKG